MIDASRGNVFNLPEGSATHGAATNTGPAPAPLPEEPQTQETVVDIPTRSDVVYGLPAQINGQILDKNYTLDDERNFIICEITPGAMKYDGYSETIVNAWEFVAQGKEFVEETLVTLLQDAGISLSGSELSSAPYRFACMDFVQTESINNNYSDSALQNVNDIFSSLTKEYAYMSNGSLGDFGNMIKNNLNGIIGGSGDALASFTKGLDDSTGIVSKFQAAANSDSPLAGLLSGYRLDLPKIWKNTTNEKTYTLKIQLSCLADNVNAIRDRIIIPYAIILGMSSPISDRSYLYKWPYVIKLLIPGVCHIPLGAVINAQIMKPGDGKTLSHNGKFLTLTLQLTIQSLYSTQFIVQNGGQLPKAMLTVNDELKTLADKLLM